MKLGNIDIRKAYMGSRELTAANAFIGTTPIVPSAPTTRDYLTFTCVEAGSVGINNYSNHPNIEYSLNGGAWTTWDYSTITLAVGDKVKMRGHNENGFCVSNMIHSSFEMTGTVSASGNVMSLIDGKKDGTKVIPNNYCFFGLFQFTSHLTTAPELPATTLTDNCYDEMFYGCSHITTAPELPATTLAPSCYRQMFSHSVLSIPPELPATTLASSCYYRMFWSCPYLTTAPELPATTMAPACYSMMFQSCRSLITAPELPATTLASSCYYSMFKECTGLINPPSILPSLNTELSCYAYMFYGCTSLINSPEISIINFNSVSELYQMFYGCTSLVSAPSILPATTLKGGCYSEMFYGCSSLINAPILPATTMMHGCYSMMFYGCSSLINAPELPATTLADYCYNQMFYGCTSLTNAPELPATNISGWYCYKEMFYGCTNLNNVRCLSTMFSGNNCTDNWLSGVAATGTFEKAEGVSWPIGASGIPSGWTVIEKKHLTLTAIESGTIGIINLNNSPNIQYKKNNGSWTNWDYSSISVSAGDVIRMKGINPNGFNKDTTHFSKLYFTNKVAASGNIMSLIDGEIEGTTTIPNSYCFYCLFFGCTQLTTSPELPATTLTSHCYEQMFHGCTSLASIQCLATNIAATDCLNNWAVGVAATGTFTKAAGVQWPSGDSGIPSGWTVIEQ